MDKNILLQRIKKVERFTKILDSLILIVFVIGLFLYIITGFFIIFIDSLLFCSLVGIIGFFYNIRKTKQVDRILLEHFNEKE